jgi:hypothetical protein
MLKTRQSAGGWGVTTMVLWDDHSRRLGFSRVAEMGIGVSDSSVSQSRVEPETVFLGSDCSICLRWLEREVESRYRLTGGGLEIIADVLQMAFENPECFGLACTEIFPGTGDVGSEPFRDAREEKEHLQLYLEQLAERMGLQHPGIVASAALLVIEKTILWAQKSRSSKEAQTARLLFQCLRHA